MEETGPQKQYNISREAASKMLGVSPRTVDRYIKSKKLSTRVVEGRVWLNKDELRVFKDAKESRHDVDKVDTLKSEMSSRHDVDKVDKVDNKVDILVDKVDIVEKMKTEKKRSKESTDTFKKLYGELKEELREKQERLEIANYRVGQLEAQVRNSVPMLEYHRENYEKQKVEEDLRSKLEESTGLIRTLSSNLKYTKFSKRLYAILLLIILALQPLWLLILIE